jgi:hypothetical protein
MLWFGIACALHLIAGFFYISSGLIAPLWAVVFLLVIWLILAILLVRMRQTGARTLTIPVAAAAIWFLVLWLGDTFLDWTA